MNKPSIILDTNVLVSALRSKRGASFAILEKIYSSEITLNISVPLALEYEEVLSRENFKFEASAVEKIVDDLCAIGNLYEVFYLWRPFLIDPDDDFILELALRSGCDYIVTHNIRDFAGIDKLGVVVVTPKEFLNSQTK